MLELLKFVFSSPWIFAGCIVLLMIALSFVGIVFGLIFAASGDLSDDTDESDDGED